MKPHLKKLLKLIIEELPCTGERKEVMMKLLKKAELEDGQQQSTDTDPGQGPKDPDPDDE